MDMSKWLRKTAEWYVWEKGLTDVSDINKGHCVEFAEMVESVEEKMEAVSIDAFLMEGWQGDGRDEWDEVNFAFYGIRPKDIDRLVYHVFLYDGERFYDAETTEGVEHFLDLPIYRNRRESSAL